MERTASMLEEVGAADSVGRAGTAGTPLRVMVSNAPRSYRDAMAATLAQLRPEMEVVVVEPDRIDGELSRLAPDVLLCSGLTPLVETAVPVWVDLYPGGVRTAVVCEDGRLSTFPDMDLRGLLELLDRTQSRMAAAAFGKKRAFR